MYLICVHICGRLRNIWVIGMHAYVFNGWAITKPDGSKMWTVDYRQIVSACQKRLSFKSLTIAIDASRGISLPYFDDFVSICFKVFVLAVNYSLSVVFRSC